MKRLILAAAAALGIACAAFASVASAADYRAPAYTWTGLYVGLQGGVAAGSQNTDLSFGGFGLGSSATSGTGGAIGGLVGYRWQSGSVVYGLEGDFNFGGPRSTTSLFGIDSSMKTEWQASLRPTLGYAINHDLLLYATAGMTMAKFAFDVPLIESYNLTKIGWTVGAGADYMLGRHFLVGLQYRYEDYGAVSHDFVSIPGLNASTRASANVYLARAMYRF